MFLAAAPGFSQASQFATVASPLVVMLLLRFVSGVPLLERAAEERW